VTRKSEQEGKGEMASDPKEKKPVPPKAARVRAAEENRRIRRDNRGSAEEADWSVAEPNLLRAVIANVSNRGCAIQFGLTRDGGAFVVRVVGDGDPYNEYVRPSENVDLYLEGLRLDFE
jgi:hypothetical protein